jgi:tetratricopeptide (TPR) repeat protein
MRRPRKASLACVLGTLLLAGCASTPEPDPRYRPAENVLEIVAVLRRHVPDDTYRFAPAQDFTGRNVYRSSLLRLESVEHVHAEAVRAADLEGVIAFAKGRALERLRAYELAAESYRLAAQLDPPLEAEARRSAGFCETLFELGGTGVGLGDLADPAAVSADTEAVAGTHQVYVVQEEVERVDMARAEYFRSLRQILPDGDVRAAAELQRLVMRHGDSKLANRHLLALAQLYEELAVEYVDAHPPETLHFDPVRFQELTDATSRLYEVVAAQDGRPEKLEASRKLEAFLAFALRVDRDRFTP